MNEQVWVFHRGALGDSILTWPMLRAQGERGARVVFVADGDKARLAARVLGVEGLDAEQRRFAELWRQDARPSPVTGVHRVVAFIADEMTKGGRVWAANAREMFPGAKIECVPGPIDRAAALRLAAGGGGAAARDNAGGPVVLHVGAGSVAKRWPIERWAELGIRMRRVGRVEVIAGEVEAERFSDRERACFAGMGGRFVEGLDDLAAIVGAARVFIGCDSGPTHLAAQLGVATVALFGPTDPERWGPIGPRVVVVAPDGARAMEWLAVDAALGAAIGLATGS